MIKSAVDGFKRDWGIPQCAGAIDVPISGPVMNHNDYYNCKGTYSVVLVAVVDYKYQFLNVYCGWPGSVHDARVFSHSLIYENSTNGTLFPDYFTKNWQKRCTTFFNRKLSLSLGNMPHVLMLPLKSLTSSKLSTPSLSAEPLSMITGG